MAYYTEEQKKKIRQSLEWAKANPTDPKSVEMQKRIQEGKMNFELKALGLNPVPVKQPELDLTAIQNLQAGPQSATTDFRDSNAGENIKDLGRGLQDISQERLGKTEERLKWMGQGVKDLVSPGSSMTERFQGAGGIAQGGFGTVFQGAASIFDTTLLVGKTIAKLGLTPEQEAQFARGYQQSVVENPAVQSFGGLLQKTAEILEKEDPNLARSIEDAAIAVEFIPATKPVVNTIQAGVDAAGDAARAVPQRAAQIQQVITDTAAATGRTLDTAMAGRRAANVERDLERLDSLTERIIQGTPDDVAAAKEALKQIELRDIRTFEDLGTSLDDQLNALRVKQDEFLSQETGTFTKEQLGSYRQVGDQLVVTNPVQDGLDELLAYYRKTNNAVDAAKISQLQQKLDTQGLTVKEINDIARLHGRDLNAFNANGELASGLSRQAAENTRRGLKDVSRERTTGETAKELDAQMSAILDTRDLIKKMENEVAKAERRARKAGFGEKAGRFAGSTIDLLTMGSLKGVAAKVLGIPGGGNRMYSTPAELQAELRKNLREWERLNRQPNDKAFEIMFSKYVSEDISPGLGIRNVAPDGSHPSGLRVSSDGGALIPSDGIKNAFKNNDTYEGYRNRVRELPEGQKLTDEEIQDIYNNLNSGRDPSSFNRGETPQTTIDSLLEGWTTIDIATERAPQFTPEQIQDFIQLDLPKGITRPTTLYRAGETTDGQLSSWTSSREAAEFHAEVRRDAGLDDAIQERVVSPDEVLVSLTDLTPEQKRRFNVIEDEEEFILLPLR